MVSSNRPVVISLLRNHNKTIEKPLGRSPLIYYFCQDLKINLVHIKC